MSESDSKAHATDPTTPLPYDEQLVQQLLSLLPTADELARRTDSSSDYEAVITRRHNVIGEQRANDAAQITREQRTLVQRHHDDAVRELRRPIVAPSKTCCGLVDVERQRVVVERRDASSTSLRPMIGANLGVDRGAQLLLRYEEALLCVDAGRLQLFHPDPDCGLPLSVQESWRTLLTSANSIDRYKVLKAIDALGQFRCRFADDFLNDTCGEETRHSSLQLEFALLQSAWKTSCGRKLSKNVLGWLAINRSSDVDLHALLQLKRSIMKRCPTADKSRLLIAFVGEGGGGGVHFLDMGTCAAEAVVDAAPKTQGAIPAERRKKRRRARGRKAGEKLLGNSIAVSGWDKQDGDKTEF